MALIHFACADRSALMNFIHLHWPNEAHKHLNVDDNIMIRCSEQSVVKACVLSLRVLGLSSVCRSGCETPLLVACGPAEKWLMRGRAYCENRVFWRCCLASIVSVEENKKPCTRRRQRGG